MTLLELCMLLRAHLKKVVAIPVACGIACFAVFFALSLVSPSYTATASLVSTGGDFTSVAGLADSVAAKAEGATVTATSSTSNRTITFTAKGKSSDDCVSAANDAVNELSDSAVQKQVAAGTVVTEAESAAKSGKSPVLYGAVGFLGALFCVVAYYVLIDTLRGGVHSPDVVAESGLRYLGAVDGDEAHQRVTMANLRFSGKSKGEFARTVLLVPTNKNVDVRGAYTQIAPSANAEGMRVGAAPSLDSAVSVLYKGREVDSVVAVVEAEVSTLAEIQELVHEFEIAGITPGGFVYLPYGFAKKVAKTSE